MGEDSTKERDANKKKINQIQPDIGFPSEEVTVGKETIA